MVYVVQEYRTMEKVQKNSVNPVHSIYFCAHLARSMVTYIRSSMQMWQSLCEECVA
jgi:hypothetical protein